MTMTEYLCADCGAWHPSAVWCPRSGRAAGLELRNVPRVLNKHLHGIPKGSVYVGRGTAWGNPFHIGIHGTRAQVIERFEREILPDLDVRYLRGKDLVCFCAPRACHADLLLKKANGPHPEATCDRPHPKVCHGE